MSNFNEEIKFNNYNNIIYGHSSIQDGFKIPNLYLRYNSSESVLIFMTAMFFVTWIVTKNTYPKIGDRHLFILPIYMTLFSGILIGLLYTINPILSFSTTFSDSRFESKIFDSILTNVFMLAFLFTALVAIDNFFNFYRKYRICALPSLIVKSLITASRFVAKYILSYCSIMFFINENIIVYSLLVTMISYLNRDSFWINYNSYKRKIEKGTLI